MNIFAFLHSARASRVSDVRPAAAGSRSLVQRHLAGWVGLSALLLVPTAIVATTDLASAGGCCGGKSYRTVSYRGGHHGDGYGGLGPGSSGGAVAAVQRRLNDLGFRVAVDGLYGPGTTDAVQAFQASNGLEPDGVVGPATASALRSGSGYREVPYRSSRSCGKPSCSTIPYAPPIAVAPPISPCGGSSCGPIVRESLRYVVVIPSNDPEKLARVRRFAPGAFIADSRLGEYINAGSFDDRDPADERADVLRAFGFDAQVRYRDF